MKKTIAVISSLGIILAGVVPQTALTVQASQPTQQVQVASEDDKEDKIIKLTLDKVLEEAVDNSRNLAMLGYQYDFFRTQRNTVSDNLREINESANNPSIKLPEDEYGVLKLIWKQMDVSNNDEKWDEMDQIDKEKLLTDNQDKVTIQQMKNIALNIMMEGQGSSDQLEAQRKQLNSTIDQLNTQMSKNIFQREEVKHGVQLMMVGRYVELLAIEQSLQLRKDSLNLLKRQNRGLEIRYELGLVALDDITQSTRELRKQVTELEQSKKQYQLEINKLLLDLDLPLDKKVELEPIKLSMINKVSQTKTTEKLIDDSFQIIKLQQDYYTIAVNDGSNNSTYYERLMVQEQINQAKQDLEKKIIDLYFEAEKSYDEMLEKRRSLQEAQQDNRKLSVRYNVGLISLVDYEQASMIVKQAEMEYLNAQFGHFMNVKQIEALEEGFIQ